MIWSEITQRAREDFDEDTVAVLPVGSIEGHGPHMPLGTDFLDVYKIAVEAARKTGALVLRARAANNLWLRRGKQAFARNDFPESGNLLETLGKRL